MGKTTFKLMGWHFLYKLSKTLSMKASDSFPVISKSGVLEWEETKKEKHQQQQNQHKSLAKKETVKQDNNKTAKKRY